jgi:hypothetical protein
MAAISSRGSSCESAGHRSPLCLEYRPMVISVVSFFVVSFYLVLDSFDTSFGAALLLALAITVALLRFARTVAESYF